MGGTTSKYGVKGLGAHRGRVMAMAINMARREGIGMSEALQRSWRSAASQAKTYSLKPKVKPLQWDQETESYRDPPIGYVAIGTYAVKTDSLPRDVAGWAELGLVGERISGMGAKELRAFAADSGGVDLGDLSSVKGKDKLKKQILDSVQEHNMRRWESNPVAAVKELSAFQGQGGKRFSELIGTSNIDLYRNADASKSWYRRWAKMLHPDNLGEVSSSSSWLFDHIKDAYSRMPGGKRGNRKGE